VLARLYRDYSRSFLQKWIKDGRVTRQGLELVPNYRVRAGEDIEVAEFSKVTSPLVGEVERSSGGGQVQSNVPPSQPRQTSGESPAGLATSPTLGRGSLL